MGVMTYLRGWTWLEFRGALPERVLNACADRNLPFWGVEKTDTFTIRMKVRRKDAETAAAVILRCQCEVTETRPCGAPVTLRRLKMRTALLLGMLACLSTLALSSVFVWNIRVEGNETLSTGTILRALKECGVGVGSFWPGFTGDSLRNELLLRLPELRWAAVNYDSSTITVLVRERTPRPDMVTEDVPTHVVAAKSGLLTDLDVYRGAAAVGENMAVLQGETLISGAVGDLGGDTRLVHALGSAKARTWYEISASRSLVSEKKTETGRTRTRFALIFGNRRVNFYGNSSISLANCDKILKEYPLAWEKVFTLPVRLVKETLVEYEAQPVQQLPDSLAREMETELTGYLSHLLGKQGEITSMSVSFSQKDGVLTGTLHAECLEEIGKEVPMTEEEIRQVRNNKNAGDESADD